MNLYKVEGWEEKIYHKTTLVLANSIEEATDKAESGEDIITVDYDYRDTIDAGHGNTKLILEGKEDETN